MKRKAWQGGLSLVELIVALTLLSGVLLMTVTVRFNFQGLVNMGMNQAILFLNTHLALDRIVSAIQHANYLEIDAPNSTLTLSRKVGEDYISSRYYRDPGGNLCYQPDLSASPLPSPEIVLPSVTGFQLTGFPEGGERFQMARVRLEAKDPQGIARRDALFQTAAFCRIFHGSYKPVRVVTRDSSGNVTTVKGSYDTIQEAIDAKTTEHGDVVQVSSNDKTPYVEDVIIKKALILEGGYDSANWERHYTDPDNPGQIHEDYETIVNSVNPAKGTIFSSSGTQKIPSGREVVIDGFTISFAEKGILFEGQNNISLKIAHNKIFEVCTGISIGQNTSHFVTTIQNNVLSRKIHSTNTEFIGIFYTNGPILIQDNTIHDVCLSGKSLYGIRIALSSGDVFMVNNSFVDLAGGAIEGIEIARHNPNKEVGVLLIANNMMKNISATMSSAGLANISQSTFADMTLTNNKISGFKNSTGFYFFRLWIAIRVMVAPRILHS